MNIVSDKQMNRLKKKLIEQKITLEKQLQESKNNLKDSVDELSTVDNHPADLATELFEREKDMAIRTHNQEELEKIEKALTKIEEGTYGYCEVCEEPIPYDRLAAIPYTSYCIEHAEPKSIPSDRPIEEDVLLPPTDDSFSNRDDLDTFKLVANYGTSETPSDFEGDFTQYDELYADPEEEAITNELNSIHISEQDELTFQLSIKEIEQARKYDYLDE